MENDSSAWKKLWILLLLSERFSIYQVKLDDSSFQYFHTLIPFYLVGLSITEKRTLKSPTITKFESCLFFLQFWKILLNLFRDSVLGMQTCNCLIFLICWVLYQVEKSLSVSSNISSLKIYFNINVAIPAYLQLMFERYIFFNNFTFNLCMSLDLKYFSYSKHRVRSSFLYSIWQSLSFHWSA